MSEAALTLALLTVFLVICFLSTPTVINDTSFFQSNNNFFWFLPYGLLILAQTITIDKRYQTINSYNSIHKRTNNISPVFKKKYTNWDLIEDFFQFIIDTIIFLLHMPIFFLELLGHVLRNLKNHELYLHDKLFYCRLSKFQRLHTNFLLFWIFFFEAVCLILIICSPYFMFWLKINFFILSLEIVERLDDVFLILTNPCSNIDEQSSSIYYMKKFNTNDLNNSSNNSNNNWQPPHSDFIYSEELEKKKIKKIKHSSGFTYFWDLFKNFCCCNSSRFIEKEDEKDLSTLKKNWYLENFNRNNVYDRLSIFFTNKVTVNGTIAHNHYQSFSNFDIKNFIHSFIDFNQKFDYNVTKFAAHDLENAVYVYLSEAPSNVLNDSNINKSLNDESFNSKNLQYLVNNDKPFSKINNWIKENKCEGFELIFREGNVLYLIYDSPASESPFMNEIKFYFQLLIQEWFRSDCIFPKQEIMFTTYDDNQLSLDMDIIQKHNKRVLKNIHIDFYPRNKWLFDIFDQHFMKHCDERFFHIVLDADLRNQQIKIIFDPNEKISDPTGLNDFVNDVTNIEAKQKLLGNHRISISDINTLFKKYLPK